MRVALSFANFLFGGMQKRLAKSARHWGFNKVLSFGPQHIDKAFRQKNQHILSQPRGVGYWLWKPYFLDRVLREQQDGDYIFYCDAGAEILASIDPLIEITQRDKQDVLPFDVGWQESAFTKRDAFLLLGCDTPEYVKTSQRLASFVLLRCGDFSRNFVKEWLDIAQDARAITDMPNQCGLPNYPDFRDHRHDQSLYSLLTKKHNLAAYRDPSQFGNDAIPAYPTSTYPQLIDHTRKAHISRIRRKLARLFAKFGGKK